MVDVPRVVRHMEAVWSGCFWDLLSCYNDYASPRQNVATAIACGSLADMKTALLSIVTLCAMSSTALAYVTINYTGLDKEYTLHTKCSGSSYKNKLRGSTTSTVTIQGSSPCIIQYGKGGITSGDVKELKGGEKITIKDGKLKKK
jgi:hypothetical protein